LDPGPYIACFWQFLLRTPRVLWVCRVPVVSAVGGGLLIASTAQTRDMFADLGLEWWRWLIFLVATFGWAWIVHWAARHALRLDDWVPDAHVPGGIPPARRPQLQAVYRCAAVAWPRLLGLLVFVCIVIAMLRAYGNLRPAQALPQADRALKQLVVLIGATSALGIAFFILVWRRTKLISWLHDKLRGKQRQWPAPDGPLLTGDEAIFLDFGRLSAQFRTAAAARMAWVDVIVAAIAGIVTIFFILSLVAPHEVAEALPRAVFVPFVLGSGVLLFTEIGAYAMRLRAPLLLLVVLIGGGAAFVIDRFHDVRWVAREGEGRQIAIDEAVKRWRFANGCPTDAKGCPRPIIIAGSGGASRAAFMTATVVGAILDAGNEPGSEFRDIRKRIFGLSTVSGSSVAAVVISAALRDAMERGTPNRPPCKESADTAWFRESGEHSEVRYWRDCFQKILTGDLLSPVLVGLFYRDSFPLGNPVTGEPWWVDRAVLLEQALERRYKLVVEGTPDICGFEEAKPAGLCRHLGYHPDPAISGSWQPLLFINGTSVETGQRIIAGEIEAGSKRPLSSKSLFPLAYDLCEMRSAGPCDATEPKSDILLSTAFTMSARFPIISPHGTLRAHDGDRSDRVVDQIVDGGYFENDGLATAADVADTLKEYGLEPVILLVTNDPLAPAKDPLPLPRPHQSDQPDLPLPQAEDKSLFESFTTIGRALYNTRSGHELGDVEYAKAVVGRDHLFQIAVHDLDSHDGRLCRDQLPASGARPKFAAGMKDVSMSWWMSQPEQAFLDAQLCLADTSAEIIRALEASAGPTERERP
jgi:hypothetical protein